MVIDVWHATEVSFRLGPGTSAEARRIAARLSVAARGCRDEMLFLDDQSGSFGHLALWDTAAEAESFADDRTVLREVEALAARLAKPPVVRQYRVERPRRSSE